MAAGIEASKNKLRFVILESSKIFSTIENFPKGKPIFAEPAEYSQQSSLKIFDGTKESLLKDLKNQLREQALPVQEGVMVNKISDSSGVFSLETNNGIYKSLKVILAIGKSGNARRLNVPGETW